MNIITDQKSEVRLSEERIFMCGLALVNQRVAAPRPLPTEAAVGGEGWGECLTFQSGGILLVAIMRASITRVCIFTSLLCSSGTNGMYNVANQPLAVCSQGGRAGGPGPAAAHEPDEDLLGDGLGSRGAPPAHPPESMCIDFNFGCGLSGVAV